MSRPAWENFLRRKTARQRKRHRKKKNILRFTLLRWLSVFQKIFRTNDSVCMDTRPSDFHLSAFNIKPFFTYLNPCLINKGHTLAFELQIHSTAKYLSLPTFFFRYTFRVSGISYPSLDMARCSWLICSGLIFLFSSAAVALGKYISLADKRQKLTICIRSVSFVWNRIAVKWHSYDGKRDREGRTRVWRASTCARVHKRRPGSSVALSSS